jgi:hypothetical protein
MDYTRLVFYLKLVIPRLPEVAALMSGNTLPKLVSLSLSSAQSSRLLLGRLSD